MSTKRFSAEFFAELEGDAVPFAAAPRLMKRPQLRAQIAEEFRAAVGHRPVRWTEGLDCEATLEIFDVQDNDQKKLLLELEEQSLKARQLLGEHLKVVFHTPGATTRHYAGVRSETDWVVLRFPAGRRKSSGLVDEDIAGDSRPPRSKVG